MPNKFLTERQKATVRKLKKEQKLSNAAIAEIIGSSEQTIYRALKPQTSKTKEETVIWTKEIIAEWRKLLSLRITPRWTYKKIAEKYGTNEKVVARKLAESL